MPTQAELKEAREWLEHHRDQIPPLISGEIGIHVAYKPLRIIPVVPLDEEHIGMINSGTALQPWLDQGDLTAQTTNLRPTEEQALKNITRKKKKHRR
jgi:hypothetical protein